MFMYILHTPFISSAKADTYTMCYRLGGPRSCGVTSNTQVIIFPPLFRCPSNIPRIPPRGSQHSLECHSVWHSQMLGLVVVTVVLKSPVNSLLPSSHIAVSARIYNVFSILFKCSYFLHNIGFVQHKSMIFGFLNNKSGVYAGKFHLFCHIEQIKKDPPQNFRSMVGLFSLITQAKPSRRIRRQRRRVLCNIVLYCVDKKDASP